jgi:hypothetical protein
MYKTKNKLNDKLIVFIMVKNYSLTKVFLIETTIIQYSILFIILSLYLKYSLTYEIKIN